MLRILICALLLTWTSFGFAQEPDNIALTKKKLLSYHDSQAYIKDLNDIIQEAIIYLKLRLKERNFTGKPAIVLDIDETALSNYKSIVELDFGGTLKEIRANQDKGEDPAIAPTLALYRFAKSQHVAVFFLTGRQEYERSATAANLKRAGYENWDGLILRSKKEASLPAAAYKKAARAELEKQGYEIILNIGDQFSDLSGGHSDKAFKLPNPYYLIP
ncbi:MAG TPA: HAD family acid phosphatase [Gammaproteobacteria bacterium]|jgi:predicted secreted acid phosphatase|nr:HAD family acid phosphatase [Gammaproteobacteria bacterium]